MVLSDEPTVKDKLGRLPYAQVFARLAETCETPIVIGLHGDWGVGKTSFMKLIEAQLGSRKVHCVWFNPQLHQSEDPPLPSLLYGIMNALETGGNVSKEVDNANGRERKRVLQCESPTRLRRRFIEIAESQKVKSKRRIVFFIDDLDRCAPSYMLGMFEGLQLYLNIPGCIYFLGADLRTLERCFRELYKDFQINERKYIEKVIQLSFSIPSAPVDKMEKYVDFLLSRELKSCQMTLIKGLDHNPRDMKRFVNRLTLNHQLASARGVDPYDPKILAVLQMIQYRNRALYNLIVHRPSLLRKLVQDTKEGKSLRDGYLSSDRKLQQALLTVNICEEMPLDSYLRLTELARIETAGEAITGGDDLKTVLAKHEQWLKSEGKGGNRADLSESNLSGADIAQANLAKACLSKANLSSADLCGANLSKASLSSVDLSGASVQMADLSMADLRVANMAKANLFQTNLSAADLSRADLGEANLSECNLCGAKLSRANMCEANMHLANLSEADLSEAYLAKANLAGANLAEALLAGTELSEADLSGAILTEAIGVTAGQIESATVDGRTVLPDYIVCSKKTEAERQRSS
jgi:uncharacterized protein YjbI with pentapeptide repeats